MKPIVIALIVTLALIVGAAVGLLVWHFTNKQSFKLFFIANASKWPTAMLSVLSIFGITWAAFEKNGRKSSKDLRDLVLENVPAYDHMREELLQHADEFANAATPRLEEAVRTENAEAAIRDRISKASNKEIEERWKLWQNSKPGSSGPSSSRGLK